MRDESFQTYKGAHETHEKHRGRTSKLFLFSQSSVKLVRFESLSGKSFSFREFEDSERASRLGSSHNVSGTPGIWERPEGEGEDH